MSETGATADQVEAAAKRMHETRSANGEHAQRSWPCAACHGQADAWAAAFVSPDDRIVPVADLLTVCAESWDYLHFYGDELTDAEQERLTAALGCIRALIGGEP